MRAQEASPLGRHRWGDGPGPGGTRRPRRRPHRRGHDDRGVRADRRRGARRAARGPARRCWRCRPTARWRRSRRPTGRLEIWDLDAARAVAGYDVRPTRYTSLTFSSPTDVIAGGELDVTRVPGRRRAPPSRSSRRPRGRHAGTGRARRRRRRRRPGRASHPVVVVWRAGHAADPIDMGLPDGTQLVGVVWSPDGRHLAVLHQPPVAGESVAVWDVGAAAFRGSRGDPQLRRRRSRSPSPAPIASSSRSPTGWPRSTSTAPRSTPSRSRRRRCRS